MKNTNLTAKATKKIEFREYTYVLYVFNAVVDISVKDFKKLESGTIEIEDIKRKYDYIDYDGGEPNFDDSEIDSYEYDGEVLNETV